MYRPPYRSGKIHFYDVILFKCASTSDIDCWEIYMTVSVYKFKLSVLLNYFQKKICHYILDRSSFSGKKEKQLVFFPTVF